MASVAELLTRADALPVDDGRRDGEVLLCAALAKPRSYLFAWPDADVPAGVADRYLAWLERRRQGEPVAYLLGEREFRSLRLAVNSATLIPRPETELLVEQALNLDLPREARVVDLGTGSGAIALALASERPAWQVTGVDVCREALAVAADNGLSLGLTSVRWREGSWFDPLGDETFSLIVSNPPYVAGDDPHLQQGDLPYEPRSALVAAAAGLADLQTIIHAAPQHLDRGGWLMLEHGYEQGPAVRDLLMQAGLESVASMRDLAGHERVSVGRYGSY